MARCLVTGGAGFIGSHVATHCIGAGHDVVVLDDLSGGYAGNVPDGAVLVVGDVSDAGTVSRVFDEHGFEYVYHLAAYAAEGLSHFIRRFNYTNNVIGSMNVLNECVRHEVDCLVFTSSIAVYGGVPPPMTEDTTPRPHDPYGIAKYAVELDLSAAHDLFGLDTIVFRPHNVYGERQNIADRYRNVIGIFMNQVMSGRPMSVFGDGTQTRAFSYIDDVAPIIARSVETPAARNEVFNIGADTPVAVNDLAVLVADAFGVEAALEHLPPRNEVVHAFSSHDKVTSTFAPPAPIALADGIGRMAAWAKGIGPQEPSRFGDVELTRNLPPSWVPG